MHSLFIAFKRAVFFEAQHVNFTDHTQERLFTVVAEITEDRECVGMLGFVAAFHHGGIQIAAAGGVANIVGRKVFRRTVGEFAFNDLRGTFAEQLPRRRVVDRFAVDARLCRRPWGLRSKAGCRFC